MPCHPFSWSEGAAMWPATLACCFGSCGISGRNPAVLEPVGWHAVIFMDLLAPGPVLPVHAVPRAVVRRALQTLLVEIDDITVLLGVVFQHAPRQRMMAVADAEKATERHVGVSHLPGQLVDHHILDGAQFLAGGIVDRGAFHLLGRDQPRTHRRLHLSLDSHNGNGRALRPNEESTCRSDLGSKVPRNRKNGRRVAAITQG